MTDMTDVARRIAESYAPLDSGWIRSHLTGLLGRLGLSVGTAGAGVTLGPRPTAPDPEVAETVIYRLLDLPQTLYAQHGEPTLVVFDEFQDLLVARRDLDEQEREGGPGRRRRRTGAREPRTGRGASSLAAGAP